MFSTFEDPALRVVASNGEWGQIEMLSPSGLLAGVMVELVADVELCVDPISIWQEPAVTMGTPARGYDGRLYATVFEPDPQPDGRTIIAVVNAETGTVVERIGTLAVGALASTVVARPEAILVFGRSGSVWRYDTVEQTSTFLTHTGFEVVGAAGYFGSGS